MAVREQAGIGDTGSNQAARPVGDGGGQLPGVGAGGEDLRRPVQPGRLAEDLIQRLDDRRRLREMVSREETGLDGGKTGGFTAFQDGGENFRRVDGQGAAGAEPQL